MWLLFHSSICLLALGSEALAASLIPNFKDTFQHLDPRRHGFDFGIGIGTLFHGGKEESNPLAQVGERIDGLNLPTPKLGCLFSENARNCWRDHFNILTDFDAQFPRNGKTVTVRQRSDLAQRARVDNCRSMTWRSRTPPWLPTEWSVSSWPLTVNTLDRLSSQVGSSLPLGKLLYTEPV